MIEVRDVVAGYSREVDILKGIALHAREREIVTLLGPNGCGKSTLLKTIAGFLLPRQGSIRLEGAEVAQRTAPDKVRHLGVGFVPQTENVFSVLSVRENLQVGGHYLPRDKVAARMHELCTLYPVLGRKLKSPAAALSGGERQILALARALMPRPRMLLLDEPSAGLSPKVLHEVFDAIVRVREQEGVTVLMVEQNAMEALRISDRAYVLSMGQVALEGRAADLLRDPQMRALYLGGRTQ